MVNIENLIRKNIRALAPYSTARDEYKGDIGIYLDANENPYDNGYNRYPDPYQSALKRKIGQIKNVDPANIFIGNGSDEPIDLVYRVFCEPRVHNVVSIAPTYGMYRVAADINDVEFREVRLGDEFRLDPDKVLAAADENTRIIFLCSPNNPSGNSFPAKDVEKILREFNGIVVVDEAYIDFSKDEGFLPRLGEFNNIIVLQTLSKAWGMAGLRLGLAFADKMIVEVMTKVKYPYNINVVTQKIVFEELSKSVAGQIGEVVAQRERVVDELSGLGIVKKIFDSDANFILLRVDDPRGVYDKLIKEGVIVRDRSRIPGCEGCLRVTIGTPEENDRLIRIMKDMK